MATYKISIAMDVRAYGFVEVEADTIEAACALVTLDKLAADFTPHGSSDDLDYTNCRAACLTEWQDEDGELGGELSIELPDD